MSETSEKLVLIADDDPNVRKLIKFSIQDPAMEIIDVSNGKDALEEAAKRSIDLVILDALMPGVHGFEVARQLRDMPKQQDLKIIMLTSIYKQKQYELEAKMRYGVDVYLIKPFLPEELKKQVMELLKL